MTDRHGTPQPIRRFGSKPRVDRRRVIASRSKKTEGLRIGDAGRVGKAEPCADQDARRLPVLALRQLGYLNLRRAARVSQVLRLMRLDQEDIDSLLALGDPSAQSSHCERVLRPLVDLAEGKPHQLGFTRQDGAMTREVLSGLNSRGANPL